MDYKKQFEILVNNLKALDFRKKIALGAGLVILTVAVMVISSTVNKPTSLQLYSNLSRQDINSMSRVLSENGFKFSVSNENNSINVSPDSVGEARMILAEYGLPASPESGYELFDNVNSLGLTSFMQDVTNKRAIQGELARTIQMISGVSSARVHLVMPDKKLFRRNSDNAPSASLVLKTHGTLPAKSVRAIRHMVASAVPGLDIDRVTIVSANGILMTATSDKESVKFSRLSELESSFELEAERKISSALGAHLGSSNFRVAVSAKLDSDQRRIDETLYDPDSRVERSVQIVREKGNVENKASNQAASITQKLPEDTAEPTPGQSSQEVSDKREEITNYEINQKKISTISDGYKVESISVALVVDSARISALLGNNPTQQDMDKKIAELEEIVESALTLSEERGDTVKVSVIEFLPDDAADIDQSGGFVVQLFARHLGSIINALGLVLGAVALAMLGVRPLVAFLQRDSMNPEYDATLGMSDDNFEDGRLAIPSQDPFADVGEPLGALTDGGSSDAIDVGEDLAGTNLTDLTAHEDKIREQLGEMISQSEERVAGAIRQWLQTDEANAT